MELLISDSEIIKEICGYSLKPPVDLKTKGINLEYFNKEIFFFSFLGAFKRNMIARIGLALKM